MSWFPQIGSGAVAQFPVARSRHWRVITNELESGEQVTLPDQSSNQIGWQLSYQDLSDVEVSNLTGLFNACRGSAATFSFADPLANLLAWSEDLTRPDWLRGPLVTAPGVTDPYGTERAWSVTNGTGAVLSLQQTLEISGDYIACFNVWLRSSAAAAVTIQRDALEKTVMVGPVWNRVFVSGTGTNGTFSMTLNPGQEIEMFGPQVEAQPYPSAYKQTTTERGIYPATRFDADELNIVSTGVGLSACKIALRSQL